ncbi:MAG: SDR family NAD(P)-dependent oxidoreductase [Gammaproteobacteria bacterium]|nr:SDR family NAD(P)-dependent oxidoreductase [Gammaproteobacteria bacterium]MDH5650598.1 SDR family NAD(P)-dependent oxidoreductase [Gammaproteobacteria bacterium]
MGETNQTKGVVFITGASLGIGKVTADLFAARGFLVIGTSRKPAQATTDTGVEMLALDVTDPASVEQCVQQVIARAGRIDVLINSAGMAIQGSFEENTEAEVRYQYEVNVLGVDRVIRAVLPQMRKQGGGRIINLSSIVGFAAMPYLAHYSASKYAIEGLSEALYHEVAPFGIKVCSVQPAVVKTDFFGNGKKSTEVHNAYRRDSAALDRALGKKIEQGMSVDKVARTIFRAATSRWPKRRYPVGFDAVMVAALRPFLPDLIYKLIWHREFGLSFRQQQPSGAEQS